MNNLLILGLSISGSMFSMALALWLTNPYRTKDFLNNSEKEDKNGK